MAQSITFTIQDDQDAIFLFDNIAKKWGYESVIEDPADPQNTIPNPESKKDFIGRLVSDYLISEGYHGRIKDFDAQVWNELNVINIEVT